jgi:glycosyltransferase involved in cell wall biosynthesis
MATLPLCLTALQKQTYRAHEIIVVDDGSTDQTAEVAQRFGVHVLRQEHQGPATARNLGVQHAQGDIVLFTDADCEPEPDWIDQMVRPLADPEIQGVKGSYRTRQLQVVARLAQCEFEERYQRLERCVTIDFVDSHAAAFRVATLREVGGYDPAFPQANNEDVDLSYRLASAGHKLIFNRKAAVSHQHPATGWDYIRLKVKRGYWRMVVYRLHPDRALRDSYTPQLLKVQVILVYLGLALALGAFISNSLLWGALACLGGLVLSSIPFARLVARQDPVIVVWAPAFVVGRALAFAVGVAGGLIGMFVFHSALRAGAKRATRKVQPKSVGG